MLVVGSTCPISTNGEAIHIAQLDAYRQWFLFLVRSLQYSLNQVSLLGLPHMGVLKDHLTQCLVVLLLKAHQLQIINRISATELHTQCQVTLLGLLPILLILQLYLMECHIQHSLPSLQYLLLVLHRDRILPIHLLLRLVDPLPHVKTILSTSRPCLLH